MKRKRLAPLVLVLFLFSVTTTFARASDGDDNKIKPRFTWTGNGKVAVVGSMQGFPNVPSPISTPFWTISLSGVVGDVIQAWLYIPTLSTNPIGSPIWDFSLTDPTSSTTILATGTSSPHDGDEPTLSASRFEVYRFNVTTLLNDLGSSVNGEYRLDVTNLGGSFGDGVHGAGIVVVCSDLSLPPVHVWINDGCEWIYEGAGASTIFADIGQQPNGVGATLHTIVGEGDSYLPEDGVAFETNQLGVNAFDSSSGDKFDVDSFDVSQYMTSGQHMAQFYAGNDGYFICSVVLSYNPAPMTVIPETPFGTITIALTMLLGLAVFLYKRT